MDGASVPVPVPVPVPAAPVVPVDYTVLKRRLGGGGGGMEVRDASGVLAFRFAAAAAGGGRALLDAAGVVLVTVRSGEVMGEWQAFSGNSLDCRDIIYMAKLVSVCSNRREVHVFMPPTSNFQDTKPSYRLIGSTSRRACTIISGDSIVSQTNLLYKLKKVVYSTRKFRVTIYPGNDTVLVMAMVMNFFLEK
ncbi:protein LURP-one-related 7-like isoform X1 [Oryza brachyantha]|uniref:Tubby C-terminal domain-containing protein n=1 Tax=Oryza brachyantha TaxID=4533 RepID=J3M631_ORYBR|nr:protein LURP-one-related 7-like isoform X1 [Oryza brachyantha]